MRYYTYFPGCSCSEGGAKAYGWSTQAVAKVLGAELVELEDWNCCGSTPCSSVNELRSFCLSARNLALAEKRGFDVVTPCSSCYVNMYKTNLYLTQYPRLKTDVTESLAAAGLAYNGAVKVRSILDVFVNDLGYDAIKTRVTTSLEGMKVAPYYGCQIFRPVAGFDDPEYPVSMDKLVASLGAQPVDFPLKTRCCGGSLIIPEEVLALGLMKKLLEGAVSSGADCIVTVCPLCQVNLDAYQSRVNKKFGTSFHMPVLFFTQLMGIAFGIDGKELGLQTNIVPAGGLLKRSVRS